MIRNVARSASRATASRQGTSSRSRASSRRSTEPRELLGEPVAEAEKEVRVLRRVLEHVGRERTHRPVGALMLLLELEPEEALEQRGEPEGADPGELRGDARVEDVPDVPAIVLREEAQVVVGVVKDDLDLRVLEHAAEGFRRADRQRVDDRRRVARRELEEVDPVVEAVEARALGVHGEQRLARDRADEALDGVGVVQVEWWCGRVGHASPR
jgi:hypothetical protein